MAKYVVTILMVLVAGFAFAFVAGCESNAQTGALIGAAAGAGIGQLAGRNTEASLIGAAVGGGAGYLIGNEGDKKKAAANRENIGQKTNTVTVFVTNSNGSVTEVKLTKSGQDYIGPKGETYRNTLPTEEQLRPIYGF